MTTNDTTPTPCDCCHTADDTWTTLPLTVDALGDPSLDGRTVRLLTHALGEDGRLHLTQVALGVLEGAHVAEGDRIDGVALMPDPEAPGMPADWREIAEGALQRRRAELADGEDPGREWWGPLVEGRHVLQLRSEGAGL